MSSGGVTFESARAEQDAPSQEAAASPGARRVGSRSLRFLAPPAILATGVVVGPKEGKGPLAADFDHVYDDPMAGQKSFERAEREMLLNACHTALNKAGLPPEEIDMIYAGDLLNQIVSTAFSARTLGRPLFGLYAACATSTAALMLAAMAVDGGFARRCLVATASHNSTAERQYRYPTEYGFQPKPWSQRTCTAAGAAVVGRGPRAGLPCITHATPGIVMDLGIKDPYQVGSAMAPAAVDTLIQHFIDTGRGPKDYDLIVTGDLARIGHRIASELAALDGGFDLSRNLRDCGILLYGDDPSVHAGASGAGCSAAVGFGHLLAEMRRGKYRRLLLAATGALHSPCTYQQGETIPCICHAVSIEMVEKEGLAS